MNPAPHREGLDTLLGALGERPDEAARAYERLRRRLIQFFRLHVPHAAEDCADSTLDRLARRLGDTRIDDPTGYALGIARLLVREERARAARQSRALEDPGLRDAHEADDDDDAAAAARALAALETCLATLDARNRSLVLDYYAGGDGAARIAARRQLAAALGIALNALRNRALRARETLERCLRERLGVAAGDRADGTVMEPRFAPPQA